MKVAPEPSPPKPLLRGWFHLAAWIACLPGTWALAAVAKPGLPLAAAGVYMAALLLLFGISATYHLGNWTETGLARMRRVDHGMIFLAIAGIYTPFCLLALPPAHGIPLLYAIWIGAALGVLRVLLWPYAPRWASVASYTLVSCVAIPVLPEIEHHLSAFAIQCITAGWIFAGFGGLCYALGKPEPWPGVLGHHEVFHLAVIGCALSYYLAVWTLVVR